MERHKKNLEEVSCVNRELAPTLNISDLYEQAYCRACHFAENHIVSGANATV